MVIFGRDSWKISPVFSQVFFFGVVENGSFHVSFPIMPSTCATFAAGAALSRRAEWPDWIFSFLHSWHFLIFFCTTFFFFIDIWHWKKLFLMIYNFLKKWEVVWPRQWQYRKCTLNRYFDFFYNLYFFK